MKTLFKQLALTAVIFSALTVTAGVISKAHYQSENCEDYLEDHGAVPGMFFSTENVVEEYEYDDAYCIVYDDADANIFNAEILVDLETYQMVMEAHKNDTIVVGQLVLNDDYSFDDIEVFTYMSDPEFDMAEASAEM